MYQTLQTLVIRAFVLFTTMPIHECAHGLAANWLGDDTAERAGRLSLNPFKHLDLMGSLMILLAGFGWAKPVPVNPYNFNRKGISRKAGMAITAVAGPLSNLLLALLFFLLCKIILVATELPIIIAQVFLMIAQINICLGVFNLLPIYPLDGSRILGFFLPDRILYFFEEHQNVIQLVFMAVILFTDILDAPLSYMQMGVLYFFDFLTSLGGILPSIW